MKTSYQFQSAALLLACALLTGPRASIAEDRPHLRVGLDGSYKVGFWTPIEVEFAAGDAETCYVIVPDPDGNSTIAPLTRLATGSFSGQFRSGRLNAPIRVRADSETYTFAPFDEPHDEPGASALQPAQQSVQFLGVVGSGDLIEQVVAAANGVVDGAADGPQYARAIRFPDWNALPSSGHGWDALDVLFVTESFPDTAEQSEALRNWVRRGGHLVLPIGDRSDEFHSSPLASWLPTGIDGSRSVNELATVVDRVPGAQPLPARGVPAARLNPEQGAVLLATYEGPLAARFAYGVGRVTVFAVDFQTPPFSEWDGTPQFCLFLADLDVESDEDADEAHLRMSGVSDLVTQMAASLDWFPDVPKPSYGVVLLAVLCFLLIVGPVDYILVHRLLKRPRRTWITFPVAVLLAASCGAVAARQAHPPRTLVNQLEVVDIDLSLSTVHIRNWTTVYSPTTRRRAVEFSAEPWIAENSDTKPRVSWFGMPENGFRGMYRTGGLDLGNPQYEFAPGYASILDLPTDQWSTKSLTADWEQQQQSATVESSLRDDGTGKLTGSLTHHFPGPVTDWMLAYGDFVYFARDDAPQSKASVAPGVPLEPVEVLPVPRILHRVLVGHHNIVIDRGDKVGGDTTSPSQRVYDPLNRDPLDLMQIITFHEAAGGRGYTGLTNATLARSDLSHLLPLHRAVFLGRIPGPVMRCTVGDEADMVDSSTFIRIILPVESAPPDDRD